MEIYLKALNIILENVSQEEKWNKKWNYLYYEKGIGYCNSINTINSITNSI